MKAAETGALEGSPPHRLGIWRIGLLSSYWVALGFLWLPLGSQVIPDLLTHLVPNEIKGTALAALEGIGTLAAFFVQPVMGALSDRTRSRFGRRRPYILVGSLGSCLFLALMTLAGSFWWLMGLYFLLQVSENSAQGPYQGLLPDVVPEAERSTASGFVGAGNLTGLLLGTVVVGTFLTQKPPDFTGALISMVVVLLIATVVVTTVVPDRARPFGEGGINLREVTVGTFMIDRRKHRDFLWLMASRLLILVAIAGLQSFAFFFFKDVFYRGSDAAMEAAANGATRDLLAVILVFALLSTLPAARVSHRVGRRPLIVLSGILGAIGTVGIILSPYAVLPGAMLQPVAEALHVAPGLAQSLYFGILIGIASGTFLAVDWAFLMDVIPADEAGRFLGFSNIATAGSGIVARFIGGPVIDIGNRQSDLLGQPAGYPVVFAIYIVFFVLGTVAIFKVRETRRRGAAAPPPAVGH